MLSAGRPLGAKDNTKRKLKSFWSKEEINHLKDIYQETTTKELTIIFNKSKGSILKILKELSLMKVVFQIVSDNPEDITGTGVYGILNQDSKKMYIGSSENMSKRLYTHINELNKGTHCNRDLQKDWTNHRFTYVQLVVCDRSKILEFESRICNSYTPVYNKNISRKLPAIRVSDRFKYYDKLEPSGDCLLWTGLKSHDTYGVFTYRGSEIKAHRIFYYWHYGVDPGANVVRHMCHNKLCCNPLHLKIGNYRDNCLDSAKHLLEDVRDFVFYLRDKGYSIIKIGKYLDCSHLTVKNILVKYDKYESLSTHGHKGGFIE